METAFDSLHVHGALLVQSIQENLKAYEGGLVWASHLGDPRNAFLLAFSALLPWSPPAALRLVLAASVSEWLNALLKWVLHGERPYWWVAEAAAAAAWGPEGAPQLRQVRLTCETGPGSPSGHVMVTSAAYTAAILTAIPLVARAHRGKAGACMWGVFSLLVLSCGLSRCFIAAHFPHQVVAGAIVGCGLGWVLARLPRSIFIPSRLASLALMIVVSAAALFRVLQALGVDPNWSLSLAARHCATAAWVSADTTPFYALSRDAGALLGLAIAQHRGGPLLAAPSAVHALTASAGGVLLGRSLDHLRLPRQPLPLFYALAALLYVFYVIAVVRAVPAVTRRLLTNVGVADKRPALRR